MAVRSDMAGQSFQPPPDAPREWSQAEDPAALAARVRMAQANEKALAPLNFPAPAPTQQVATPVPAPAPKVVIATTSRLRTPGVPRPSLSTPAETSPLTQQPKIILTDAPGVPVDNRGESTPQAQPDPSTVPVQVGQGAPSRPERPAVDPQTAAHLSSPLAEAARKLHDQRTLTHQPAASNTDSPSRGLPTGIADPGKQITGGFGDAGDAQYFPLDGSELRELVRGLMSVIDEQLTHDLRFSMAITYPRVTARVIVEVEAYAAGGDGGQYDPGFVIQRVIVPHDKTPIAIARARADQVCFVIMANRVEMNAAGESISPPNQLRQELGLAVPRKQAVSTPTGRVIVDLPT